MLLGTKQFTPSVTITGRGKVSELRGILDSLGKGLILHGRSFVQKKQFRVLQYEISHRADFHEVSGREPRLEDLRALLKLIYRNNYSCIISIGGGAVLDLGKAAAGLANAKLDPELYMYGGLLEEKGIPFIAVPTTAGSGAEASINAVIINEKNMDKLSIRDDSFMARTVILDPELLENTPPQIIAHSGLDAITQAIESYFSVNASWFTETLALKGFELLISNIEHAYKNAQSDSLDSQAAFRDMLLGSYLTGIAFTNSRLGIVHGLAHPLGAYYNVPHGQVCAICLLPALELNRPAVEKKYADLSAICRTDLIQKIKQLSTSFHIVNVFHGLPIKNKEKIIESTLKSGSTAANPKKITRADVEQLLSRIFV